MNELQILSRQQPGQVSIDNFRELKTALAAVPERCVKLEHLAQIFGIDQPDAHRAWCDAQANALLYIRLKALAG